VSLIIDVQVLCSLLKPSTCSLIVSRLTGTLARERVGEASVVQQTLTRSTTLSRSLGVCWCGVLEVCECLLLLSLLLSIMGDEVSIRVFELVTFLSDVPGKDKKS